MIIPKFTSDWINVDNNGDPCQPPSNWMGFAKGFEWFGFGFIYYIGEVISVDEWSDRVEEK